MTRYETPDEEERGFVETALAAADAGNAGHWPTVATYLAAEVRRLRALAAVPHLEPDREALRKLMRDALDAYVNLGPKGYWVYLDSILALLAGGDAS